MFLPGQDGHSYQCRNRNGDAGNAGAGVNPMGDCQCCGQRNHRGKKEKEGARNLRRAPKASNAGLCAVAAAASETPHSTNIQTDVTTWSRTIKALDAALVRA